MEVHPAALPLDLVDLAFAVLLAPSLEGQQLRVARKSLHAQPATLGPSSTQSSGSNTLCEIQAQPVPVAPSGQAIHRSRVSLRVVLNLRRGLKLSGER